MWDRIVLRKEDALINVVAPPKYPLRDVRYSFKCAFSFIIIKRRLTFLVEKPRQFSLR